MRDSDGNLILDSSGEIEREVWDEASFYVDVPISLRFIPKSAREYNHGAVTNLLNYPVQGLDTTGERLDMANGKGAPIHTNIEESESWERFVIDHSVILACDENAGYVTLRVQAVELPLGVATKSRGFP
jgi:hypothetical protein